MISPARAKKAVQQARETDRRCLLAPRPEEIYFTAGGSESDNWALKATAEAYTSKGKPHHHNAKSSITRSFIPASIWRNSGFEITYLDVDENGVVKLDELEKAIRPDTILISVMFANNEIGTIQPIEEIGAIAKEHGILFHTDAVQAFGQLPINVDVCHIDMLSASGHKLNGPKGIGFLYIRKGVKIRMLCSRRSTGEKAPCRYGECSWYRRSWQSRRACHELPWKSVRPEESES